jgi:hypothetical protein
MPHQFLSDFDVDTKRSQVRRERMTEAVPADLFSNDSDPRECGANALLQDAVGTERLGERLEAARATRSTVGAVITGCESGSATASVKDCK